jgi:hypothetical protein
MTPAARVLSMASLCLVAMAALIAGGWVGSWLLEGTTDAVHFVCAEAAFGGALILGVIGTEP